MSARELITEHLNLWTGAVTKKSSSGRGSNGKVELTGVKKLRELILELAVRGKLVEQNPTDEPASKLLERIRAEKLHSIKQGEIKKRRKLPELSEMTKPFDLPSSWEWGQLEDVGRDWGQKTPKDDFSYIDVASVDSLRGEITQPSILSAEEAPSRARKIVSEGTLIYSTVRPYLQNIAVIESKIEPEPIASTAFAILHPLAGMPARFYLHYLRSPAFVRYVESVQTGIAYPAINDKQFFSGLVPVPPLEEQHRIVQKVDELMALCDRLEQQTSDQLEAHETLVDTLLGTLTQSENATQLADNWARLAAHFDTLFTTEQSIDKLKQTILQLAVMGRLVEQDAGDEPAENMLGQLAEVKKELITQGRLKKERKTQPVDSEDAPYEIPESWSWCSLTDIGELARGKSKHRPRNDPSLYQDGTVPLIQTGDVARASPWIKTLSAKYNQRGVEQSRLWRPGTLCITIAANIGDTGLLSFDACFPDSVVGFTPFWSDIPPEYFEYFLRTAKQHLEDFAPSTAQKNINLEVLQKLLVPLPPASEMKRIVQKVDELIALCDQLKERLNQASETRNQLAEAVVQGALN
ncbi:restriction endonuclease subunit S [Marinobacter sp.]|uniref:restriction endonuclease subunit S n=1 Tax=Marinobacter sp. TaxID=50741 RepID=UPI000C446945|nr:restriction endonuclease subunit S [Marinobacter sp.]MAO14206.1 restriction endonuclease subunit S [Marinobacter sp.]